MQNGWIKLHRKLIDNSLLTRDLNAYIVFTKLLLVVDRKNGSWSGGRFQLAELTGLKPTTAYQALKRMSLAKMVTTKMTTKFTTITICKWKEYQGNGDSFDDNKMTTKRQQDDNKMTLLQEDKKVRIKKVVAKATTRKALTTKQLNNQNPEITQLIRHFEEAVGHMGREGQQVMAAVALIKQHGFKRSYGAISAVAATRDQQYAPSIGNLEDLLEKWVKLETFFRRKTKEVEVFDADVR